APKAPGEPVMPRVDRPREVPESRAPKAPGEPVMPRVDRPREVAESRAPKAPGEPVVPRVDRPREVVEIRRTVPPLQAEMNMPLKSEKSEPVLPVEKAAAKGVPRSGRVEMSNRASELETGRSFILSTSLEMQPRLSARDNLITPPSRPAADELRIRLDGSHVEFQDQGRDRGDAVTRAKAARRSDAKSEKSALQEEKAGGVTGSQQREKAPSRPPLMEKSFVERKKKAAEKDENIPQFTRRGNTMIEAVRAIKETDRLFSMFGTAFHTSPFILDPSRNTVKINEKTESRKGIDSSMRVIDELSGNDSRFTEEESFQDFLRHEKEKTFERSASRKPGTGAKAPEEQSPRGSRGDLVDIQKEIHHEELVQETREMEKTAVETKKLIPDKQVEQAAKQAATSIESVIKKSQHDLWTGDEMAAKLIYLLMKASSTFTFEHSSRVIDLSVDLARELGITDRDELRTIEEGAMFHDVGEVELDLRKAPDSAKNRLSKYLGAVDLQNCSFLHDIGKVKIPDSILYKPGKLTDEEYEILKQHPVIGEAILKPIPSLQHVLPVVRHHHERYDGKGYPDKKTGEDTPLAARIVGITDAYDAMVSDRPYRKGMPVEDALAELKRCAGSHFDPRLVEAFVRIIEREKAGK
ncbi:MAG: HD domain-containing protein, partial [Candidatus Eremiobacteraeota bacterium]|nr:HD domain-containing protein [Candidatus Eremiobacteraeota bacterium]